MMINIHAAKSCLSRLVARGEKGKRITIARAGRPVAQLVPAPRAKAGELPPDDPLLNLEQSAGIRVEWIGADRFAATKIFFRKHSDQDYSFTDCSSFTTMREMRVTAALTTDRHFKSAGFQVLLPLP